MNIKDVKELLKTIKTNCLGVNIDVKVFVDKKYRGRLYLQAFYFSPCSKTKRYKEWQGRKNYLSEYMTEDEVVKTAYLTYKQAVEHEIMEGFTVNNTIVFNPHVDYKELIKISNNEIERK